MHMQPKRSLVGNHGPWWGFSIDIAYCSQGRTKKRCQCFVASIASLVACYDSLSSYQHASHGSQFWRAARVCQIGVECWRWQSSYHCRRRRCWSRLDQDFVPCEAISKRLQLKRINPNHLSRSPNSTLEMPCILYNATF